MKNNHKPLEGLEPPTGWLQVSYSTNWVITAKCGFLGILLKSHYRKEILQLSYPVRVRFRLPSRFNATPDLQWVGRATKWTWRELNPRPKLILNIILYAVLNTRLIVSIWLFSILNTYHQNLSIFWSCIKQRLQNQNLRLYLSSSTNAGCPSSEIILFLTPSKPLQALI